MPDPSAGLQDPGALVTVEERTLYCADVIARGRWLGRPTVQWLARAWRVGENAVQRYGASAAIICKADRGELEQAREVSVAQWAALRDAAAAAGDIRGATQAQAGLDRASGVTAPGSPQVLVQILDDPRVRPQIEAFARLVLGAVAPWPEALLAARGAITAAREGRPPILVEAVESERVAAGLPASSSPG